MPTIRRIVERIHAPITDKVLEAVYGKGYYVMDSPPAAKEPHEVYIKIDSEEKKLLGYACPECKLFHNASVYACNDETARQESLLAAQRCCHELCRGCSVDMFEERKKTPGRYVLCSKCRAKQDMEREQKRIDKAKKIPLSEYDGRLCVEDEFYEDVGEFLDHLQDSVDIEDLVDGYMPTLWAVRDIKFSMDAEGIIEQALEEHYEDAGSSITTKDISRLQRMLDKWCKDQDVQSYECDYDTVIVPEKNFWIDGLLCSHDGCDKQAVVYAADDSLCCHCLDHRKENIEYRALIQEDKP